METTENEWFIPRKYLHITNRITELKAVEKKIKNPNYIKKHAFFPLLRKELRIRRYKKTGQFTVEGKAIRKHNKKSLKKRVIEYATHIDTLIFSYYRGILSEKYETLLKLQPELSACIGAYRRIPTENGKGNKNNIHFAKEVFDHIQKRQKCVVLAFDIESFYPSLHHKYLKKSWCNLLNVKALPEDHYAVFKAATRFSYILQDDFRTQWKDGFDEKHLANLRKQNIHALFESPRIFREEVKKGNIRIFTNGEKGIPHGLPISSFLANLYLLEFDKWLVNEFVKSKGVFYRRYSDDIIVVCDEENYEEIEADILRKIKEFHLNIKPEKTEIYRFDMENRSTKVWQKQTDKTWKPNIPLLYLGFEFYGDKTLIRSTNLAKFYRRMKSSVRNKLRRIKKLEERTLTENLPLFKRKINRIYTEKGAKARRYEKRLVEYKFNREKGYFTPTITERMFRYRGNFISYAQRAAQIMNEDAILRQIRNNRKILAKYLKKK